MAGPRDLRHGGRCHGKTWINVLFGLLQLLLPCIRQGEAQLQALAQMASVVEVWEAEEAELLLPSQGEEDQSTEGLPQEGSSLFDTRESMSPLSFQPPALAYGAQPLGLPRAETVHVHNPSQELPVTVLSMFTPSRHFHTPSFHRRVIPPRGKASFKLIFFPTEEGSVESTLFINTTLHGVLSYQVSGVGVHHGSSNVAQNRDGTLVFPHIQSIKLTQTQGDASNVTILGLLMESTLPKNYVGHPQGSCFQAEQKLVAQISLSERGEKHTDLEKLKPYVIENILVLFVVPPAANSLRVPKINIYMLNSGVKKLFVKEIQLFSKVDSTAEFKQVLLRASSTNFTQVASLVCKGPFPAHGKKCFRQISLQLLRNHTVKSHPAFGIHSRDLRDGSPVQFHISQTGEDHADIWLTSPLDFSFEVRNVTMTPEMDGLLEVVNFSGPLTVQPGCWRLLSLQLAGRTLPVSVVTAVTLDTSLGVSLELPLHFHFHSSLTKQGDVVFEASGECGRPCRLRLSESGRAQWQRSFLDSASSWQTDSILASELCARWRSHKKRLTCSWPRLPVETSSPLDFGASPVNESKVKFFTLKNPSSHPVSVELRPLASYSAPLGALDLLTKWFNISPLSVNVTATEFTLLKGSGQEEWRTADGALRLLLQPLESREVGVSFTPAEHKSVTSLILIRNNLTVFDVVMVRGQGARELLRIGGKLPGPGASLRFNVPQSTLMECRDGLRSNKPLFAIRKSFKVENAGELPLTVESMNINGYKCQGFGFEILQCRSFQLDYNSSSEINIVFTPDFTSSWVIRDMTLVTARGSTFPFTLNVTLPHHMLPLCAQVVPGPSWEETFWLVTIIFTCLSLGGVCLMAFHRAQYILNEFSSPGPRSNHHNSVLSRENGVVNAVSPPTANKIKGSCKTFVDSCNTSDKGKGKGSLAVANTPVRSQASSKKGSGALSQPQRKHKASLYYGRYKVSSPASAATALVPSTEEEEERGPECGFQQDPETCCSLSNGADEAGAALPPAAEEKPACLEESRNHDANEEKEPTRVMFPMETHSGFAESVTAPPSPRPGPLACSPAERPPAPSEPTPERKEPRRRDVVEVEPREESHMLEVPQPEKAELVAMANGSCKGKKNAGKNRRKPSDAVAGIPEPIVVVLSEKSRDLEWRDNRTAGRARNHCANGKLDTLKSGPGSESLVKQLQNGARMTRSRRKGPQRRPQWESGSDSASSSGSVRASRGSWGSWSSTSSVEGERDTIGKHHCNAAAPPTRKRDNMQHMYYPERDCHQALNSGYKTTSMQSLHRRDPCQSPEPAPTPSFSPSFAAVAAAGVDRNADTACPYLRDEKWAAPSVPLTNEFRYNTTESLSVVPQASTSGSYSCFPWGFADNPCANPYPYCEQNSYMPGNAHLQNSFTCPESKSMAYNDHPSWTEDSGQDMPATWISPNCMASKPFFSGTRSLSPMSGLFGSIWTPQSEPYQSTFQPERSLPPSPESPFVREPVGSSRPKPFSNFNPFGPHMNLDIWNSSSNRSSNSQLSNDSGYCGDT